MNHATVIRTDALRLAGRLRPKFRPLSFSGGAYDRDVFGQRLLRLARRRQRARAVRLAPRLLAIALVATLLFVIPATLAGVPQAVAVVGAAGIGGAALVTLGLAFHVPAPKTAALAYDLRLGLHERLSTAVSPPTLVDLEMQALQRSDALATARTLAPDQAFPWRLRRRDVVLLALAAGFLALWLTLTWNSPLNGILEPAPPAFRGSGVQTVLGVVSDQTAPGAQPPGVPAELAAQLRQLQEALSQLQAQIDPDADASNEALQAAAEGLRRSSEARELGRALSAADFDAAAAELRQLASELEQLNAGQLADLAESLRAAASSAQQDPDLADRFDAAAAALDRQRLADAREALRELAQTVEAAGASVANNEALRLQIAALQQQLAAAQDALDAGQTGLAGETAGAQAARAAAGDAATDDAGAGASQSRQGKSGTGDSTDRGGELPDRLEGLSSEQRLDAQGRLELVPIQPSEEGSDTIERPVFELGRDTATLFEASAGVRGFAAGRRDVDRTVPADLQPILDRYFASP